MMICTGDFLFWCVVLWLVGDRVGSRGECFDSGGEFRCALDIELGGELDIEFGGDHGIGEARCFSGESQGGFPDRSRDGVFGDVPAWEHESGAVVDTDLALGDDDPADGGGCGGGFDRGASWLGLEEEVDLCDGACD